MKFCPNEPPEPILPPEIIELIDSCESNCNAVENNALELISHFQIAVFNMLRDFNFQNCLDALKRLNRIENVAECYVYLMVLTEYMCTAYHSNLLYKTFEVARSQKFTDTLFHRLYLEWMKVFKINLPGSFTSSAQFKCILRNLRTSVNRLPEKCRYKNLLREVLSASDRLSASIHAKLIKTTAECPKRESTTVHVATVPVKVQKAMDDHCVPTTTALVAPVNVQSVKDDDCVIIEGPVPKPNLLKTHAICKARRHTALESLNTTGACVPKDRNGMDHYLSRALDSIKPTVQQMPDSPKPVKNAFEVLMRKQIIRKK